MINWLTLLTKNKWVSWVLFILTFTGCIALLTYAVKNGGVSHDSSYYLRVAQSLLEGEGLSLPAFQGYDQKPELRFPVIRPVGYPIAVAIISGLFQIPVLIGAKALSVFCASGLAWLFFRMYGYDGFTLSAILLTALVIELYFSVLSGGLFTLLLVLWAFLLAEALNKDFSWYQVVGIGIIGGFLFITRYVGIVVFPVLGLLTIYNPVKHQLSFNIKCFLSILVTLLLIGSYLTVNYLKAGLFSPPHVTEHPFQKPSTLSLIGDYLWELLNSINMLFNILYRGEWWRIGSTMTALTLQIGFGVYWFRKFRPAINRFFPLSPLTRITWLTAFVYLAMLLAIFLVKFYTFSYRFVVPALLLLAWGGFHQAYYSQNENFLRVLRYTMVLIVIVSVGFNVLFRSGYHLFWKPTPTFPSHLSRINSKYQDVPKGSFIIFPEKDLNYLRTDLVTVYSALTLKPDKCFNRIKGQDTNNFYLNTCNPEFTGYMNRSFAKKREQWGFIADTAQSCLLKIP